MPFGSLMRHGRRTPQLKGEEDVFSAFRRQMDHAFDDFFQGAALPSIGWTGDAVPRVDVKETDKALEITAELPGVDENDIEVELAEGVLIIKGEKKEEREEQEKGYYVKERAYGAFLRHISVPFEIKEDKIKADFSKGVLTLVLPKPPEAEKKTKKIKIKTS